MTRPAGHDHDLLRRHPADLEVERFDPGQHHVLRHLALGARLHDLDSFAQCVADLDRPAFLPVNLQGRHALAGLPQHLRHGLAGVATARYLGRKGQQPAQCRPLSHNERVVLDVVPGRDAARGLGRPCPPPAIEPSRHATGLEFPAQAHNIHRHGPP